MRTTFSTFILLITLISQIQAKSSVYIYIIPFENITKESSIDWLGSGFVDMLYNKLKQLEYLQIKNQEDLEGVMNNRSILLHQPRGSKNFLLLGKFERKLDAVEVGIQLVDIATWEEVERRKVTGNYNKISELNSKISSIVELMLTPYIPAETKKESIYPAFSEGKTTEKKPTVFSTTKEVSKDLDVAIDELEKSMDLVIGARDISKPKGTHKQGEEWVLDIGQDSNDQYSTENDANTLILTNVIDDLMNNPYQVVIEKPKFEYDEEDSRMMEVNIQVEYSLKDNVITDMLKSLPYNGLKQDGSLMIFSFHKDKFNFSDVMKEKIRLGKYRAVPVLSFVNSSGNTQILIVDTPESFAYKLNSDRIKLIADHQFSPLIEFTIGGWAMQVAMESVVIPVNYQFKIPVIVVESLKKISLKFVPEADLINYVESLL